MHIMIALYFFFQMFMVNLLHYWVPGCSMYRIFTLIVWGFLVINWQLIIIKCTAKMLISHISLLHVLKFWIIIWTYFYLPSFKLGRVQWTASCIVIKNYGWKLWVFEFFNTFTAFPFYIWIVSDFFSLFVPY